MQQESKLKMSLSLSVIQLSKYLSECVYQPFTKLPCHQTTDPAQAWKGQHLPWNGLSCLSVVCYVLKFSDSVNREVLHTLKRLNDLASDYEALSEESHSRVTEISFISDHNYPLKGLNDLDLATEYEPKHHHIDDRSPQQMEKGREIAELFVNCFVPQVRKFFTVPERNEQRAGFINFLLQILNSETDPKNPQYLQDTDCESEVPQERLTLLRTGLTFLLAVLGDIPFHFTELEENRNLLANFNCVANEAGSFIYSFVFGSHGVDEKQFYMAIDALLENANLLNENIKEHCIRFSEMLLPMYTNQGYTDAADSFFIVNSLLKDLEDFVTCEGLSDDMKCQIRTLHQVLISAQSFLKDLNMLQDIETQGLKECFVQFRDIAYEAEYLINSFVVGDFPDWYLFIRIPNVIQKLKMTEKKVEMAKAIFDNRDLNIYEDQTAHISVEAIIPTPMAMDDHTLVGFQKEMIEILDELAGGSDNLRIISIYGMPGLGKTTLAKKLYYNPLITSHFDERVWYVFSQSYNRRKVLIDMLMSLRSLQENDGIVEMRDSELIESIYKSLKGRRYLIVMDDVWDSAAWDGLGRYFPNDRNGSRILITTRTQDIVPKNGIGPKNKICTLPFLSEDQCWELLEKRVFIDEPCPTELQGSGKQIASKCNGLPLAVVVIAGALANMAKEKSAWERVEESIETYTGDCMKLLELSYEHLPNHLKLCFLYLAVFLEDAEIPVKKLIWLWIAEGFVGEDNDKSPQDVAEEYLKNLISRSLVLVSKNKSTGGVKACKIHDLLQQMCLKRAQKENFLYLVKNNHNSTYEKHRRLCARSTTPSHLRPFSLYCRSFFGHLSDPSSCLPQMKHLRVMKLSPKWGVNLSPKLNRIDLLVHLRYLVVDRMPEAILGNLVNLEVLCVDSTLHVVCVPSIVLKMAKLRHLHVKLQAKFHKDCDSSQPNNLQSLSFLSIHSTKAYETLTCSPHLRKLKCICPPEIPDFRFLTELKSLKIEVSETSQIPRNNTTLNFPLTITKLSLLGTYLPWEKISILGRLPALQALKLLWNAFEGKKWETSEGEFQGLRFLKLDGLNVRQWRALREHFPRLQHLVLHNCDKLRKIPTDLGDFPNLMMIKVHNCSYKLSLSAVQIEQEQHDNGNEDMKVIITDRRWSKEDLICRRNR